ncbi:MAG: hypothetical protein DRJ01_11205 [Bacteroidetes bacterium]|nr:MAG: hypothetical protein DRJ01_11205 [Bacteroidota bacterium]
MKTLNVLLAALLVMGIVDGCNSKTEKNKITQAREEVNMEKSNELGMDMDSLNAEVQSKSIREINKRKVKLIEEGVSAIDLTYKALVAIEDGNKDKAIDLIERGVGKLEVLLARDEDLVLIPIKNSIKTEDFQGDLESIKTIKKAIKKAIEDDYYQVLRDEIAKLGSEVRIETVSIPILTYPDALKLSASFLENNEIDLAKETLQTALNTLVISEKRIPLPILRAESLLEKAKKQDAKDEVKKKEVLTLLENAEYQLTLAEELGYGNRDKKYKELNDAINGIRKSVKADSDSQGLFDDIIEKLSTFKDKIIT